MDEPIDPPLGSVGDVALAIDRLVTDINVVVGINEPQPTDGVVGDQGEGAIGNLVGNIGVGNQNGEFIGDNGPNVDIGQQVEQAYESEGSVGLARSGVSNGSGVHNHEDIGDDKVYSDHESIEGRIYIRRDVLRGMINDVGGDNCKYDVRELLKDLAYAGYHWKSEVEPSWLHDPDSDEENRNEMLEEFKSVREDLIAKRKYKGKGKAKKNELDPVDGYADSESDGHYDFNLNPSINWDELRSIASSDEELDPFDRLDRHKREVPVSNEDGETKQDNPPIFYVGQIFGGPEPIKEAIRLGAIHNKRQVRLLYNDLRRVRAVCDGNVACPYTIHASPTSDGTSWQIKTYTNQHLCNTSQKNRFATANWLAKQYMVSIRRDPNWSAESFIQEILTKHGIQISKSKAYRAKKKAEELIHGTYKGQYRMLRDYCHEILEVMPGSTIRIDVEDPTSDTEARRFRRVYICLEPLKKGFAAGCRRLIGLDGAHVKGPYPGQILTAVGIDSNDGIYPIAYAVVEIENNETWKWFLELLIVDLKIENQYNWTVISDEQKGLLPAVEELLPYVEHRHCVFHMYKNFKKLFKGEKLKDDLTEIASAYSEKRYAHLMEKLKASAREAHDWIAAHPPKHWARSHFRTDVKSDILYNNLCECLNGKLVPVRDKPLISLLEGIRNYLMKRICVVRQTIRKLKGPLCPDIQKEFEKIKALASDYQCTWNGDSKYQLKGPWNDQCFCDLETRTCSCRKWDLTGIPCKHAVAAIYDLGQNGGSGVPEEWVNEAYHLKTWKSIYQHTISPINGPNLWVHQTGLVELLPPYHHVQPGRPKKKRKIDRDETRVSEIDSGKLSRKGTIMKCSLCGSTEHNRRTCKGEGGSSKPKPPTVYKKVGRPRKVSTDIVIAPSQASASNVNVNVDPGDAPIPPSQESAPIPSDAPIPPSQETATDTNIGPSHSNAKGKRKVESRTKKTKAVSETQGSCPNEFVDVESYVVREGPMPRPQAYGQSRRMLRNGKMLFPLPQKFKAPRKK